jgi:hypothetical protein
MKLPSAGGNDVSTIGLDHTSVYLTNRAVDNSRMSTNVGYIGLNSSYAFPYTLGIQNASSANGPILGWASTTAFSNPASVPSIQFPPTLSVSEALLTSGCLTVEYLGSVNAASGEIIVGTYGSDTGLTNGSPNYGTASYGATSMTYPISKLLQDGIIRVPLVHNGPISWQFCAPGVNQGDYNLPFLAFTGLPDDGVLKVQIFRNWEIKSPLTANGIPYESRTGSNHKDLDALQDSIADLGRDMLSLVSFGWPKVSDVLSNGVAKQFALTAASSLLSSGARMLLNKNIAKVQESSFIHPMLLKEIDRATEVENNHPEGTSQSVPVSNQVSSPITVPSSNNNNTVNVPTQGAPGPGSGWFSPSFARATDRQ